MKQASYRAICDQCIFICAILLSLHFVLGDSILVSVQSNRIFEIHPVLRVTAAGLGRSQETSGPGDRGC